MDFLEQLHHTFVAQIVGTYITYYCLAAITLVVICLFTLLAVSLKETSRRLMTQKETVKHVNLVLLREEHYINVDKEIQ